MSLALPVGIAFLALEFLSSQGGRAVLTRVETRNAPFKQASNRLAGRFIVCPSKWQGRAKIVNSNENDAELGDFIVVDLGKDETGAREQRTFAHLRRGAVGFLSATNPDGDLILRPELVLGEEPRNTALEVLELIELERNELEGEKELQAERLMGKVGDLLSKQPRNTGGK